jgi:ABC-type nickel/cobalt efflux system permease component RcnA
MSLHVLFEPFEHVDAWLSGLLEGAPLLVALAIAFILGLRHASDPDHLVAVTSLVAADDGDARRAARLGAWWGLGHAGCLVLVGLPMIAFKSEIPGWLELAAERAVGVVIVLLAARVILKWVRGDYRASAHRHETDRHRHLRRGEGAGHRHVHVRTPRQALAIGLLHGLAGTGAVVLLLVAALPGRLEAALALAVFAPMSIFSMALCTTAFAWILTRRVVEPVYRAVLIPAIGTFGLFFGLWYTGIT